MLFIDVELNMYWEQEADRPEKSQLTLAEDPDVAGHRLPGIPSASMTRPRNGQWLTASILTGYGVGLGPIPACEGVRELGAEIQNLSRVVGPQ